MGKYTGISIYNSNHGNVYLLIPKMLQQNQMWRLDVIVSREQNIVTRNIRELRWRYMVYLRRSTDKSVSLCVID